MYMYVVTDLGCRREESEVFIQPYLERNDGQGDGQVVVGGGPGKVQLKHLTPFYKSSVLLYG